MKTKKLTMTALLIAVTTLATMIIHLPFPGIQGYLNLGDGVLLFAAMLLGPVGGFVVGSIGSALADLLLGYAVYAPFTFIVKGLEGLVCGALFYKMEKKNRVLAALVGQLVMTVGYFITEIFLYGTKTALVSYLPNLAQGLVGAALAIIIYPYLANKWTD